MKVALIGASGHIGSRLLAELSRRDHAVTAIVRNPERVPLRPDVTAKKADVADVDGLSAVLKGHDAVISSVHFSDSDPHKLLAAVHASGVRRYLVVGGAGSLEVAPGVKLIDTPEFPAIYKEEAAKGAAFLDILRKETVLDWTYLSPAAMIAPGERTGVFRLGGDRLLSSETGSNISTEDYAVAMVDELERPVHTRKRFSVAY